jgi:hypothetical protein
MAAHRHRLLAGRARLHGRPDYVSPDATIVTAFIMKNPAAIVDEMMSFRQVSAIDAKQALADAQQKTGVDLRNDLAAALGGRVLLPLDGSCHPVPSWKLVIEVYDPVKVQSTLQKSWRPTIARP